MATSTIAQAAAAPAPAAVPTTPPLTRATLVTAIEDARAAVEADPQHATRYVTREADGLHVRSIDELLDGPVADDALLLVRVHEERVISDVALPIQRLAAWRQRMAAVAEEVDRRVAEREARQRERMLYSSRPSVIR